MIDWRFRRLIWLLPAAYALHIAEEYAGGFPAWVTGVIGGRFDDRAFAGNNAAFFTILLALTGWTARTGSRRATFALMTWASGNIFWDALFHVATTAATDRYSPGLVTAACLYLPLSPIVAHVARRDRAITGRALAGAAALGLALFLLVVWYGLFRFALP